METGLTMKLLNFVVVDFPYIYNEIFSPKVKVSEWNVNVNLVQNNIFSSNGILVYEVLPN